MKYLLCSVLVFCLLGSCGCEKEGVKTEKAEENVFLKVPINLTVVQRRRKVIRAFGKDVVLKIGDITGGQVLTEIIQKRKPILDTVSMKPGDAEPFTHDDQIYYLQLKKLQNFLTGDDFAVFIISIEKPEEEKTAEAAKPMRNPKWAQPVELEGVPNLHKVSDALYRSAQPTEEGMKKLKEMGIKTIVNLRSFHSDRDEIGETGLGYEHIYMKAWHPEDKELVRFLQIVSDKGRTPVLVHCMHGADRTGTMSALYRIVMQGWSKEEAIEEMTKGGYSFHGMWKNLITYLNELDIDGIKKQAEIK